MPDKVIEPMAMISGMNPELQPGEFVFSSIRDRKLAAELLPLVLASFNEAEGLSLILATDVAEANAIQLELPMRLITLNVYSSLEGTGLTAAVASALAACNIPCNIVAAYNHDHVFVPAELAEAALASLKELQGAGGQ